MSKLDSLIAELCPDGVEYVALDELFDLRNGYTPSKANDTYWQNGTVPWFRMEDIRTNGRVLSDAIQHVSASALKGKGVFPANSIIVATSATIGEHALITCEALTNQRFVSLYPKAKYKNRVDIRFMFYYFDIVDEWCRNNLNEGNFASVDMGKFAKLTISLPPLIVQREIVRILDNFTELIAKLTAKLTAELTARKKQYEYYRNELLTFGDDVPMIPLGTVAMNLDSKRKPVTKGNRKAGEYPYYGASGIVDYVSDYIFDGDYLLVSEDGANLVARVTPIAFSASGKIWVNNHAHILKFETYVERKFIEHYLNMIDLSHFISTAAQPKLTQDNLNKIPVPAPSFAEQVRIVAILDKFDALTTGIANGLPAEIEARRKQYEYYRNKLLTFKEAGV